MKMTDHPIVELTSEQRMRWGTCPVCQAKHGQPCDHMVGFPLGMNVHGGRPTEGAHLGSEYADPKNGQAQEERIRALSDSELCRFFTAATLSRNLHVSAYNVKGNKPEQMLRLAEQLGVDAEALRQEVRNESLARVPGKKAKAKAEPTPETALAGALKKAQVAKGAKPAVRYRHPSTGETWSGRGLQPAWLKAALANGRKLEQFRVEPDVSPQPRATLSAAAADPFRA